MRTASALAHPNIAFIKYWGNQDEALRLPSNGSISMNLAELQTTTRVTFNPSLTRDVLTMNHRPADENQRLRVSRFLDIVRQMAEIQTYAEVVSENNFPAGSGIASSASAFAALALAASKAAGLECSEKHLSALARRGSGSASRSIPSGFVEWTASGDDLLSISASIAPPDHWDLVDIVVILDSEHKKVGSTEGHNLAGTSPLQNARVLDTPRRLDICRDAILTRNFNAFAGIIEQDCLMMHAVMMTSLPSLLYWKPQTITLINKAVDWRANGLNVAFTIDAGPNVHLITTSKFTEAIRSELHRMPEVINLFITHPGGPATLLPES